MTFALPFHPDENNIFYNLSPKWMDLKMLGSHCGVVRFLENSKILLTVMYEMTSTSGVRPCSHARRAVFYCWNHVQLNTLVWSNSAYNCSRAKVGQAWINTRVLEGQRQEAQFRTPCFGNHQITKLDQTFKHYPTVLTSLRSNRAQLK